MGVPRAAAFRQNYEWTCVLDIERRDSLDRHNQGVQSLSDPKYRADLCIVPHCHRRELYTQLASASLEQPHLFATAAVAVLRDVFRLKAASLYTLNPAAGVLRLKAQTGFDYRGYTGFEVGLRSIAGRCVVHKRSQIALDTSSAASSREAEFLGRYNLIPMLAVPLVLTDDTDMAKYGCPNPIGALCLYLEAPDSAQEVQAAVEEVAPFIARLYLAALDTYRMHLRTEVVRRVAYSTDVGSLLYRALGVLRDQVSLEAASVYLLDHRNGYLRLAGATGLTGEKRREQVFLPPSSDHALRNCLDKDTVTLIHSPEAIAAWGQPIESIRFPLRSCLVGVLRQASVAPGDKPLRLGVLVCLNKRIVNGGCDHPGHFSWEDAYLVQYFSELISVLLYFLQIKSAAEGDFERRMHGAKHSLNAALNNLELLDYRGNLEASLHEDLRYSIPDSIAYLSDIRSQLLRLELRDGRAIPVRRVQLYGEVLSKMPKIIARTASALSLAPFEITNLEKAGFSSLPAVRGDHDALMCVFRNLSENAVKYSANDRRANAIDLSFERTSSSVLIRFADSGIGIPPEIAGSIFVEGVRGANAVDRYPGGLGMGLADCREIMRQLGGDIRYVPDCSQTVFEVTIPIWQGEDKRG